MSDLHPVDHDLVADRPPASSPGVATSPGAHDRYAGISTENINEALYLLVAASVGLFFNVLVIVCILSSRSLRRMTNAFIVHGCTLDAIKCLYCVPFATSLLRDVAPAFCAALGGSYVVIVTASGFNIVAMVCCEAYAFSEHNVGAEGRGSFCCAVFGILMVYIGSIIIHLGPTIIGGDFNYNDLIGNCIFVYGTIKSYVVHAMWIVIMTIAMIGAAYYLVYFYRHIQANSTHRLATLVRASVAISRGNTTDGQPNMQTIIRQSLSRSRALMLVTVLFILCWYPLYILTLVDPKFKQPTKIYKLLTFIAWSNSSLNPLVLLLFDNSIDSCRRICCCLSPSRLILPSHKTLSVRVSRGGEGRGGRAAGGGGGGSGSGGSGGESSPRRLNSGALQRAPSGDFVGVGTPAGLVPPPGSSRTVIPEMLSTPESVYLRVGCRLCTEGRTHTNAQCNGGGGRGGGGGGEGGGGGMDRGWMTKGDAEKGVSTAGVGRFGAGRR